MALKCYYAHPITDYGTWREAVDVRTLEALGFEVENPNQKEHDLGYKAGGMGYFMALVDECDMVAFRPFIDGKVPAGVAKEVYRAIDTGKPVIELFAPLFDRVMSVEETRARLIQLGRK